MVALKMSEIAVIPETTVQDGVSTVEDVSCETTGYFWMRPGIFFPVC